MSRAWRCRRPASAGTLRRTCRRRRAGRRWWCGTRGRPRPGSWNTPGLVETRFSPDALVWVAVVFHGTAAWRNHGLIIFPLLFYRTSVQLRCPDALVWWRAPPARLPAGGLGHLLVGHPRFAPRVPRAGQG